jgi:hypothetical protein
MTLTPEQFNKLVTKKDYQVLVEKFERLDSKFDRILISINSLAKKVKDLKLK